MVVTGHLSAQCTASFPVTAGSTSRREVGMVGVPEPRKPVCTKHHYFLASCPDCRARYEAAREEARKRIGEAKR